MATSSHAAVTPDGIRDGDPAALAALVERRGNAVLAYCEAVCPPAEAERAAAEAFARFRSVVAHTADARTLDPDVLLLRTTRHAAASLTRLPPAPGGGLRGRLRAPSTETRALVPGLLAARAEGELSGPDEERLARHLERDPACRALADAVARAERAYADPPARTVPIHALTEIMLALAGAAPILAAADDGLDFVFADFEPVTTPEPATASEPLAIPDVPAAPEPIATPEPAAASPPAASPEAAGTPEATAAPEAPEGSNLATELGSPAIELPGPAGAGQRLRGRFAAVRGARPAAAAPLVAEADADEGHTLVLPAAASGRGVAHPRPTRGAGLHLPGSSGDHGLLYRYVLPGALVAAALLAAMGVAGVFASDEPPAPAAATTVRPDVSAPPAGAPPVAKPEADVEAEEAAALAAARRATARARAKAAAKEEREEATPAATVPEVATTPTTTLPPPAATPAPKAPRKTTPAPGVSVEPDPEDSGLPDTDDTPAPADPGVFEDGGASGTTP